MLTQQIHKGLYYEAFTLKGGLIVHRRGNTKGGKYLDRNAEAWIEAIKTAIDTHEADALCRAIYK